MPVFKLRAPFEGLFGGDAAAQQRSKANEEQLPLNEREAGVDKATGILDRKQILS